MILWQPVDENTPEGVILLMFYPVHWESNPRIGIAPHSVYNQTYMEQFNLAKWKERNTHWSSDERWPTYYAVINIPAEYNQPIEE